VLSSQAEAFLSQTAPLYEVTFDRALREHVGVGLAAADVSDLPRLMRGGPYDGRFTQKGMLPALEQTLDGLGLALRAQPNIHLDTERRPNKDPRAFCAGVQIPSEVYLVISPTGGLNDYEALFHEAGHAEHFACMGRDLPFEFRYLGDSAITECFAFTIEWLLSDANWLGWAIGGRDNDDVVTHLATLRLYFQRRYCAKLLYELEFHAADADAAAMGSRYDEYLSEATRIQWRPDRHMEDLDEGFYVLAYLRAWSLATSFGVMLRERFGRRWFNERRAGMFLREIWEDGQRLSADELADELDLPRPNITLLAEEAERLLAR
jgi:hypothetical protein